MHSIAPLVWIIGPSLVLTVAGVILFHRSRSLASALTALGFAGALLGVIASAAANYPKVFGFGATLKIPVSVWWMGGLGRLGGMWLASLGLLWHALSRYRTHVFQNRGEARLSRALKSRFLPPDYHLLNHLTLRLKDGTTQIDHVLVSRFGVFVIETKDYKGWIFAGSRDRYWTQVLYRAKFRFQNPIRQNYRHVSAVQELLDFLPPEAIQPIVVFTGPAEFKTPIPDGVFTSPGFLDYVDRHATEVMSVNRVQFCVGRLETARLSITKTTDVEHVQQLRSRYRTYE